jgi:hypothetical protein
MKKTLFLLLVVFFVFNVFSQTKTKDEYLQSSRELKTAGWVLVGVGTVIGTIGITLERGPMTEAGGWFTSATYKNDNAKAILTAGGAVLITGCIPLFVLAKNQKRKAAKIGFNHQQLLLPHKNQLVSIMQPTMTLKIRL